MPGFAGIPIYYFFRFLFIRLSNESWNMRASSIAFNFFLALVPALIFMFGLLPYIPIRNLQGEILMFISEFMPHGAYELLRETLIDIMQTPRGGLLSISFILTLYYMENGFHSLMEAFDKYDPRPFLKKRLIALGFGFVLAILLMIGISILLFMETIVDHLFLNDVVHDYTVFYILPILKWLVFYSIILIGVTILYYYGSPRNKRWKLFMPGNFFASFIMLVSTFVFGYYVEQFSEYNKIFGSLGAIIVIMILMYINAVVLVIGYDMNDIILISRKYEKIH